jgi:uroporphyrin-III C-methyltransferase
MADGLAPDMPVAVVENGARTNMRVLRGPLAALPELVDAERVKSPALIVIGEVTRESDTSLAHIVQEYSA